MSITHFHTVDDLIALGSDAPFELIDGELREVSPCSPDSSRIAVRITAPLFHHVEEHGLGIVTGADGGFRLSRPGARDTVVAPDVGFIRNERIPAGYDFRAFFPGAPDLAAEVESPSDSQIEIGEKIARLLAAGTHIVWHVRPAPRIIVVHRPGMSPVELGIGEELDGEDVVPEFRLALASIFRYPMYGMTGGTLDQP